MTLAGQEIGRITQRADLEGVDTGEEGSISLPLVPTDMEETFHTRGSRLATYLSDAAKLTAGTIFGNTIYST